jgi:drug/metabolite transporter (DMT)-like permease
MNNRLTLACCAFAAGIGMGQLLFKLAADDIRTRLDHSLLTAALSPYLVSALILYVLTTALWIGILMHLPLGRAYPFALLGAALVPLLAKAFLGETLDKQYFVGMALVLVGILIVTKS